MLGWIYRVLVGNFSSCKHSWKIIQQDEVSRNWPTKGITGYMFVQECKHCGKLNKYSVGVGD